MDGEVLSGMQVRVLGQVLFEAVVTVWAKFCKIDARGHAVCVLFEVLLTGSVLGDMQFGVLVPCCLGCCLRCWCWCVHVY